MGQALREIISVPDRCRDALRVTLHLVSRINLLLILYLQHNFILEMLYTYFSMSTVLYILYFNVRTLVYLNIIMEQF